MSLTVSISLSEIQKNRLLCEMGNELSDLYSDPNGSPLLSLKELEPQYYMQIAEYVKDRVRMNSIPRMAVILFMDKILSKDISTVKAEVISNIIKYTFPMDSKETAVMLYFAYCYIVKVAPPRANDVKALLGEAKKCKAEGAQKAIAILKEKFFPQTQEATPTHQQSGNDELIQQLQSQIDELKQQLQEMTDDRDKYKNLYEQQEQPKRIRKGDRGPFGETDKGKVLNLEWFCEMVEKEYGTIKSIGEWAAVYHYCRENGYIHDKCTSKKFFDFLFNFYEFKDSEGNSMAIPRDPISRYCNALAQYGIDHTYRDWRTANTTDTRLTKGCFDAIKNHFINIKAAFKKNEES